MINRRAFCSFVFALVFLCASLTLAQQGWSQSQVINKNGAAATINAVAYDGDIVWVVGADGVIVRSHDNGGGFQEMYLGVSAGLNDVFIRGDGLWIVGDGGNILVSEDGGRSFVKSVYSSYGRGRTAAGSGPLDLYSVYFSSQEKGHIVGDEGLILSSSNGGFSWQEQRSGTNAQLFHLSFKGDRGWTVGTGGTILRTYDGGKNWYPQRSGVTDDLNRIYMITDKHGLITGDNGVLLRTDNGGATWERVALRVTGQLFGISFIDKEAGWIVGEKGVIIRTYDGGRSWVEQESATSVDLFSVAFRKNRGFAIGRDGIVMRYYEKR